MTVIDSPPCAVISKQPTKVIAYPLVVLLPLCGAIAYVAESIGVRFVMLSIFGISTAIVCFMGFLAPILGGIELTPGRVEQVTNLGGIISIELERLDRSRSALSPAGLLLVPMAGERIWMSAKEYSRADILRVAHVAGLSTHGWAQEV